MNNKKAIFHSILKCKLEFEKKIENWVKRNKKIIIIGTEDHTNLIFKKFKMLSKVNVQGFINYPKKFDFYPGDKVGIRYLKMNDIKKVEFDEVLISSYEYNFEIDKFLSSLDVETYKIYDSTSRDFFDIFNNNLLAKYEGNKL